jgi:hypothetical protein
MVNSLNSGTHASTNILKRHDLPIDGHGGLVDADLALGVHDIALRLCAHAGTDVLEWDDLAVYCHCCGGDIDCRDRNVSKIRLYGRSLGQERWGSNLEERARRKKRRTGPGWR